MLTSHRARRVSAQPVIAMLLLAALAMLAPASASAAQHHARRGYRAAAASVRALSAANRASTRADHVLVADARRLKSCMRSAANGAGCNKLRSAVQRAGRAYSSAELRLSRLARSTSYHGGAVGFFSQAPTLSASGYKLSWDATAHAGSYVLQAQVPGQSARYSVVEGTATTPSPVPGDTVTYEVRSSWGDSRWSNAVTISYPAAPAPPTPTPPTGPPSEQLNTLAAPALRVSGQALSWNVVAAVSTYVLVTKVPGQPESFTTVTGTSTTPPAVPGKTVGYSVRTAVDGSAFSPEVTISYPAEKTESAPAPSESSSTAGNFEAGIDSGTNMTLDVNGAAELGTKIVRIEFSISETPAQIEPVIAAYAAKGIRVAPLAGFYGAMPSPGEARGLAAWAKAFGPGGTYWAGKDDSDLAIRTIEFGNETSGGYQYGDNAGEPSYQERAKNYATRIKEASEAISATGEKVGLLAVAEDWTGDWMNGMFQAVPNLGSYIAGWVSHPYGSGWRSKIEDIIKQAASHGAPASLPIDITEWGISTDGSKCVGEDYGFNPCMNYAEAAEQLKRSISEIKGMLGLRTGLFILYQVRDQQTAGSSGEREAYFGLLQHEDQPKGAYTAAAQELLAA